MKFFKEVLKNIQKKDNIPMERYDYSRVRMTIEFYCEKYLTNSSDIFKFEALPSAIDATLSVLEGVQFQEKYEFSQVSETCFIVRLKELSIL